MNIHEKKLNDFAIPLENEQHEKFAVEYVLLDSNGTIPNTKARKIAAYRRAFDKCDAEKDWIITQKATLLLNREDVAERIEYLYGLYGNGVENKYIWTDYKSKTLLSDIAYCDEFKPGDRIKAIAELNRMTGIDTPIIVEEDNGDEIDAFLESLDDDEFENVLGKGIEDE